MAATGDGDDDAQPATATSDRRRAPPTATAVDLSTASAAKGAEEVALPPRRGGGWGLGGHPGLALERGGGDHREPAEGGDRPGGGRGGGGEAGDGDRWAVPARCPPREGGDGGGLPGGACGPS